MSTITIQIPDFLRRQVERLTTQDGFSIELPLSLHAHPAKPRMEIRAPEADEH